MKEISVSPSLSKTELHGATYLWDVTGAAHGMPQSLLILKEQEQGQWSNKSQLWKYLKVGIINQIPQRKAYSWDF